MRFMLHATAVNGGEFWSGWAWVEIDAEQIQTLLARRELFQMVKSRDEDVETIVFWGNLAYFFEDEPPSRRLPSGLLSERELEQFEEHNFIRVPDERALSGVLDFSLDTGSGEWTHTHEEGVVFCSDLGDVTVTTILLPYDVLLAALPKHRRSTQEVP